jgi:hypothetical protein
MIPPQRNNPQTRLGLLSVARFRGLIQNRGGRWKDASTKTPNHNKRHSELSVISEETREESAISETSSELESVSGEFEDVIRLISSPDMDRNRVGMQRLMVLTTKKHDDLPSSVHTSRAIVYGGGQLEEEMRSLVMSFISDEIESFYKNDSSSSELSFYPEDDDDDFSTEEDLNLRGRECGGLHVQALHVISNSLEHILSSDAAADAMPLDFLDPFWRGVVDTLCHNIESSHSLDATGYSMKILRLLHTFEPLQVTQLLRNTLLPYLAHFEVQGKTLQSPMVESEASKLIRRADVLPGSRIEI